MRIEKALASVATLHDLPALVDALGGEPRFGEIAPRGWLGALASRLEVSASAEVGRFGAMQVVGVVAAAPPRVAERIARYLFKRGDAALVVAITGTPGPVSFAVSVESAAVLTVDPTAPDGMALSCLRRIAGPLEGGRASIALRVAEALNGQRVDRAFFSAFAQVRDRLAGEGPVAAPRAERQALALLQLTRVLFLYFIQHKGWLDGRHDFIARSVDDHLRRRRSIARGLLRPLFHGTLNRRSDLRSVAVRRFGRIPFLNGGLFEPHLLERRWAFDHSDLAWRAAFDDLFERFHFTVDERGDARSVAPDMLGRVFEGLMAGDERSATGTFYTPVHLVDRLVTAAAGSLVAERLGVERHVGAALVAERAPDAGLVLSRCRALDPAVGSGAFLLGALHLFTALEQARDAAPGHRRRILRSQLFGVDISAEAVRLAELRLWLAAVADDPDGPGPEVEPLPNLDAALRQGDSLHDPGWLASVRRVPRRTAGHLAAARAGYAAESGPGKRTAWLALRDAETSAAAEALVDAERELARRITHQVADGRAADLFGMRRGLDRPLRAALRGLRADLRRVRQARRRLSREGSLPWFDAHTCFGEIFSERGGFDLVVGNPPWVRAEEIPAATRRMLADRYRWWRARTGTGFGHRPDLAVAFLERGIELCAPGGTVAMLLPAKLATAGYATVARAALVRETTLDHVDDLSSREPGMFGAVTYPLAIVMRKRPPDEGHSVALSLSPGPQAPQARWSGAPWILRAPDVTGLVDALRAAYRPLADQFPVHLGVKSGCNAAFLEPLDDVEPELLRDGVRGRGIAPFRIRETTRLLFPHDDRGRPLTKLPPGAARHLAQWRSTLDARADAGHGPWWALHRTVPACSRHRVAWPDLSRQLQATQLRPSQIPLNSCYLTVAPTAANAAALCAWLNSTPARGLAVGVADRARGDFARFNARVVGQLPLPDAAKDDEALTRVAVDGAAGREVQDALDRIVSSHLGLDDRDRRALRALA